MNQELYELLLSYQNKELDEDFINKAFEIMMKYETINDYVNNFNITEKNSDYLGSYSNEQRAIQINILNILNDILINNKKILALQVLRHELEHARNLQSLHEKNNDIETRIIRYGLIDYAIKNNLYYGSKLDEINPFLLGIYQYQTYNINPGERIAEIKSWKYIVNLLKNQRRTNDLLMARSMLYYSYIRGYKSNGYYLEPPTYEYLLKLKLYHEHYLFKKSFNNKNYNFDTRLLCGLPISDEENDKEILLKVKLQKRKK